MLTASQWTGINAVLYYAPFIFQKLGLSGTTTSLLATGVVGIVMLLATIPSVLWIDRVGRKPVLTIGAIGMGTCHLIIAVIVAKNMDQWTDQPAAGWAAVCMVWLFVIHFGYSWGPCAWIIVAEIWPLSTRPYGVALGASSNWMNNFIVGQVTPDMLAKMPYGTYILFGALTYIGAAFIWFFVPETKRLTLEEMVRIPPPRKATADTPANTLQTGHRLRLRGHGPGRLRAHAGDQRRDRPDPAPARRGRRDGGVRVGRREAQGRRRDHRGRVNGERDTQNGLWLGYGGFCFLETVRTGDSLGNANMA